MAIRTSSCFRSADRRVGAAGFPPCPLTHEAGVDRSELHAEPDFDTATPRQIRQVHAHDVRVELVIVDAEPLGDDALEVRQLSDTPENQACARPDPGARFPWSRRTGRGYHADNLFFR